MFHAFSAILGVLQATQRADLLTRLRAREPCRLFCIGAGAGFTTNAAKEVVSRALPSLSRIADTV
jgi:hypothetical protein